MSLIISVALYLSTIRQSTFAFKVHSFFLQLNLVPETSFCWSMGLCNRIWWLPEILVVEGFSSEEQVFIYLIQLHCLPQLKLDSHRPLPACVSCCSVKSTRFVAQQVEIFLWKSSLPVWIWSKFEQSSY